MNFTHNPTGAPSVWYDTSADVPRRDQCYGASSSSRAVAASQLSTAGRL